MHIYVYIYYVCIWLGLTLISTMSYDLSLISGVSDI